MSRFAAAYLASATVMLILDAIWLSVMGPTYRRLLDGLLTEGFRLVPAAVFYFIYVAGIALLAVLPALRAGDGIAGAAVNGAMLGFVAYATYDLTNHATLKTWHTSMTLMDMAWGTILTATAAAAGAAAAIRWQGG